MIKTPPYSSSDLIPTLQTEAILDYMRWRSIKKIGRGLNERSYEIICKRVGLKGYKRRSFRNIAEDYNVCGTRISEIYNKTRKLVHYHCKRKNVDPVEMHIIRGDGWPEQ